MTTGKVIVHTDIVVEHLVHGGSGPSFLRRALGLWLCYTTVFNAIELFSCAANEKERAAVRHALAAMKLLGLNAKGAPQFGDLLRAKPGTRRMNLLIAGLARESRLPVFTSMPEEFPRMKGLRILGPGDMPDGETSRSV